MRHIARTNRAGFRRAVIASVVIHLVLAATVVVCAVIAASQTQTVQPGVDTRIQDVKLQLDPEESSNLAGFDLNQGEKAPSPPERESTQTSQPPTVRTIQNPLPPGFMAIIHRSQNHSVQPATTAAAADTEIKPAGASAKPGAAPLHGAMKPEQSVVYILDCSGSMGEFGKLGMARSALIATLRRQPDALRFQVIPYNSNARLLLPGGLTTIAANLDQAEIRLAKIEAVGRSNHMEAVRAAVDLRPEAIVWLTDADDLSVTRLKPILSRAGKPIPIYLVEVTARGVGTPQELH
jgi:hypothetical protein